MAFVAFVQQVAAGTLLLGGEHDTCAADSLRLGTTRYCSPVASSPPDNFPDVLLYAMTLLRLVLSLKQDAGQTSGQTLMHNEHVRVIVLSEQITNLQMSLVHL